ncbi:MAG: M48 family metallopeptidase [Ideonella sp.]|nr:M48 family metallopeptidase [Ideonella sp.]
MTVTPPSALHPPAGFDDEADFRPSASLAAALRAHGAGCGCALHRRRLFGASLLAAGASIAVPSLAQDGVQLDKQSQLAKLVPAEEIEAAAAKQYAAMLSEASKGRALAPADHPQLVRLRAIAQQMIPFIGSPNLRSTPRAAQWKWEVNLIGSKELNAFCMPGGKIAFYTGILDTLQLTDDEVAMVMGHEIAHALREHARERVAKNELTHLGASLLGQYIGGGKYADLFSVGSGLLTLKFSRDDETEADVVGMDLAARAGFDPRAGISLWQKMSAANKGAPPQWFSTHPSGNNRIQEIEKHLPEVMPLYEAARARKPRG